jgi:hypothetical protein
LTADNARVTADLSRAPSTARSPVDNFAPVREVRQRIGAGFSLRLISATGAAIALGISFVSRCEMKTPSNGTKMMIGIAAGLLTGALSAAPARADQPSSQRMGSPSEPQRMGPSAERTTHETVVVTGIDRSTRNATLQNAEGEKRTVKVPSDVKAFDTLKVGDRIDIDYYESMAVSMMPPGTKPSMSERTSGSRMGEGGGAMGSRETTVSAEILNVDLAANKVTFKGPKGQAKTITVADPAMQKKLPGLKPGQVVQFTYTEAIAASIRPAASSR